MPQLTLEQLGQKVKAKYPEYANVPDAELAQRVIAKHPEYASSVVPQAASTPAVQGTPPGDHYFSAEPSPYSITGIKKKLYETADRVTNALPAIGGIVGGAIGLEGGPLGAVGGAGIGGMGGEAARRLTRGAIFGEEPTSVSDVANGISMEGAKQGAYEASGRALQAAAKGLAPRIAEAAVAPGKRLLKSIPEDVNIGQTILDETKGISPKQITKELQPKIAADRAAKVQLLRDARANGTLIPIAAPQDMSKLELEKAAAENAPEYLKGARDVRDQLHFQMGENGKALPVVDLNGQPTGKFVTLPDSVDPERFDALRQGVDRTIGSFNPETAGALDPLRKQVRGTMARSLHDAVPGTAGLDARMTRMIPANEAAFNTSFNPGITKNVYERFARPTGAAAMMIAGGAGGYQKDGVPGAALGAAAGLGIPLLLTSPSGMMFAARMVNGRLVAQIIKGGRVVAPIVEGQATKESAKPKSDQP
jgi:hypothetical protein